MTSIVVNRPRMEVLCGDRTLLAAREFGWSALDATFVSVDEEQAKRILLVDNRTSDLAGYDLPALADLLKDLPDLEGTGYDQAELGALLDGRRARLLELDPRFCDVVVPRWEGLT